MIAEQKLALGTVQFGLNYGIANKIGMTSAEEAGAILEFASDIGIDTLDTAVGYGHSESVLGSLGVEKFRVITKLPGFEQGPLDVVSWTTRQLHESMSRLHCSRLAGVLLHRPSDLLGTFGPQLYSAMLRLKKSGLVEKIGISIYDPAELDYLAPRFKFDLIQAPLNILDRRLIESGWAERLHGEGVEIHTRSCFLQGLLLMSSEERPKKFNCFELIWQIWHRWLSETNLSPLEACVRYAASQPGVAKVVIGVDSAIQLAEIASAINGPLPELPHWPTAPDSLLLNPSNWGSL